MYPIPELIVLFTDFGIGSHYVAQVRARLLSLGVSQPVVELCSDAPRFNPEAGAHLLASFRETLPDRTLYLAVIDPGVGTSRAAVLGRDEGRLFLAPDNGLLSRVAGCSPDFQLQSIRYASQNRSRTFDGRDLFAPVAARLARGQMVDGDVLAPVDMVGHDWPDERPEVIYIDHFGNAITGLCPERVARDRLLLVNGWQVPSAGTFAEVLPGSPFWYVNSNGLLEIAVNRGSAAVELSIDIGTPIAVR